MVKHRAALEWAGPVAFSAIVLALAGWVWLLGQAKGEARAAALASCDGFAARAEKLFDTGGTATLTGTFTPGDHVHLAIDFRGGGYAWELTGAIARTPIVTGSDAVRSVVHTEYKMDVAFPWSPWPPLSTWPTKAYGDIGGAARLELEIDVVRPGDGAITIKKTGSTPSAASPSVAAASCKAAARPTA